MRIITIAILAVVLASFAVGLYFYPQMPEDMAAHWNVGNHVDGYMPRFWGVFLMPIISAGMFLLFMMIPAIDPMKRNIAKFRKYYDRFVFILLAFLLYIYLLTVFWNVGGRFSMIQLMAPAFGILFYYAGVLTENAKTNWFVGIRTPWTLSSRKVWEKTHKLGGKLFKIAGMMAILGTFFPDYAILLVLAPVIFVAAFTIVYSYVEYRKRKK
jgi:uncharacterized membrane protein